MLNLGVGATREEIRDWYFELAKLYHPDVNPGKVEEFRVIKDAYEVLTGSEEQEWVELEKQKMKETQFWTEELLRKEQDKMR